MTPSQSRLAWYWNRLRCMTPAEVLYRARSAFTTRVIEPVLPRDGPPPAPAWRGSGATWLCPAPGVDAAGYLERARRLATGRLRIFALEHDYGDDVPDWNADPLTGIRAPRKPGKAIDYRDNALVGDIKYLWEPNRHLQLVWLCQAWRLDGDATHLERFRTLLDSWLAQCPCPVGPNWSSSLELGIRLINWSACWQLAGGDHSTLFTGDDGAAFRRRWLDSIYQHCRHIDRHWSRYSSANNHLIGEAAGLAVAAVTWPCWEDSPGWAAKARDLLHREIQRQTTADGVNREQAVSYQQFVLDFLLVAALALEAAGQPCDKVYWDHIERMLDFLASIMDVAGRVPMIGDADDGYVLSLSAEADFCPYRSLLATGAILFQRGEFLRKAGGIDDKTRWLLGERAPPSPGTGSLPVRQAFPEGGYYILGCDFETDREIRGVVDCGELGYLKIAAHGHADALAFTLSVAGREFLVDAGTYAYHTRRAWRDYFRGTAAHNTVRVDGREQSEPGGSFMWVHRASARADTWRCEPTGQYLAAHHDGYQRLPDAVRHERRFSFDAAARRLTIEDTLCCNGRHGAERLWHFSEDCEVLVEGRRVTVRNGGVRIVLRLEPPAGAEVASYRGSLEPVRGWISRSFDSKTPTTTVVERFDFQGTITLKAVIDCAGD